MNWTCFAFNTPEPSNENEKKHRQRATVNTKKSLYEESKRTLAVQEEKFQKGIIQLTTDYDILK